MNWNIRLQLKVFKKEICIPCVGTTRTNKIYSFPFWRNMKRLLRIQLDQAHQGKGLALHRKGIYLLTNVVNIFCDKSIEEVIWWMKWKIVITSGREFSKLSFWISLHLEYLISSLDSLLFCYKHSISSSKFSNSLFFH